MATKLVKRLISKYEIHIKDLENTAVDKCMKVEIVQNLFRVSLVIKFNKNLSQGKNK